MEDFTVWTVEGEGFKVCKEGFNHPVLYEHLVELPLDLAESISESIPGLGCGRGGFYLSSSGDVWCCLMLRFTEGGLGYERACLVRVFNLLLYGSSISYKKISLYLLFSYFFYYFKLGAMLAYVWASSEYPSGSLSSLCAMFILPETLFSSPQLVSFQVLCSSPFSICSS